MLPKFSLFGSALLISCYYISCDTTPSPILTKVNLFVYVPYVQDAMKWEISDVIRNVSDAETARMHLELIKLRLDEVPLLAAANSLMSTTMKIYIDVISGQSEDIDSIVSTHVDKGLECVLKNEEPENAQKVKQAFIDLIVPAMKKLKSPEESKSVCDEVIEAMYSASVAAETSLSEKDSFKLFRVSLAAMPEATEEELAGLADATPKPGDKVPLYRPHDAED